MRALINVRLPQDDNGEFIDTQEFRKILQEMGLRPADMPKINGDDSEDKIKEYCLKRAKMIFDRMPENSDDEKRRKEFSLQNIIYASDLPTSNTLFMVTAHTEGEYRFRLLNPKIEELQEGCKDLVLKIRTYNRKHQNQKLEIEGKIGILEHGLEEFTISGTIVESRWKAIWKLTGRDILITAIGLALFIAFSGVTVLNLIPSGDVHNIVDRLSSAMFTATMVSGITIYYTYRQLAPVIQWTTSYER